MRKIIDLRSDTVTRPSPAMREAIARAEVGDDVLGEDPSVNRLEALCAQLTGKEAALFVSSGTMGNLLAVKSWTQPGDEVIAEETSHIPSYEAGGSAVLSGVQLKLLRGERGSFTGEQVKPLIRPDDVHQPITRLICVENTHTMAGGAVFPLTKMESVAKLARERTLKVHCDGARIWNASIAAEIEVRAFARCTDSLSFCFSKGLGCPAGSILCGPKDFVARARRYRKLVGGGMRQAGVLAAAALYALRHNIRRLREDHRNARRLAEGLAVLPGVSLSPEEVETNILLFRIEGEAREWVERFRKKGVLLAGFPGNRIRAVTHLDVSADDTERAIEIARHLIGGKR